MLNPTTIRFDVGRGGKPTYTADDIRGALGMVRDEFARNVLCVLYWPDGGARVAKSVDDALARHQFGRWRQLFDDLCNAQIAEAMADDYAGRRRAEKMIDNARAAMWPQLGDGYRMVRAAVMHEIRSPKVCLVCNGQGSKVTDAGVIECSECRATGRQEVTERKRAEFMQRHHSTYLRVWAPVYDWTFQCVAEADFRGRIALEAALRD